MELPVLSSKNINELSDSQLNTLINQLEEGYNHILNQCDPNKYIPEQRFRLAKASKFIGNLIDIYMDRKGVQLPNCLN